MRSLYNEKALIKNPCVLKVDRWRLTLRTDFKIELFELWRNGEMDKIEQRLTKQLFRSSGIRDDGCWRSVKSP